VNFKILNPVKEFSRLISGIKEIRQQLQREARPKLDIPELERVTQAEVVQLVDWELKQAEEQQKLFGVGSWPMLVGLAGIVWATVSLPALKEAKLELVAIAFLLAESSLALLRILWTTATRSPEALDTNRALRTSIIAGADTNITPLLSIFQNGVMLMAASVWIGTGHANAGLTIFAALTLCLVGNLLGWYFLRLDIHIAQKKPNHNSITKSIETCFTAIYLLLAAVAPIVGWLAVQLGGSLPSMANWQLAALLVAAAYLLRQLLSSKAQARHQGFLRNLRRDLVLGFVKPPDAALKLAWQLSGFPTEIYVRGRLRALTQELGVVEELLAKSAEQLKIAIEDVRTASDVEKAKVCGVAAKFLQNQVQAQMAAKLGEMGKSQADIFLSVFGEDARKSPDYRNWESAHQKLGTTGKAYARVYQELLALVQGKD
jgi:hypothetical protein